MSGQGSETGGEPQTTTTEQPRVAEESYVDLLTAPLTKRFAKFAGATGAGVGAAVLVVVGTFLVSMGFGSVTVDGQTAVQKPGSVAFGNLLVNAVAVGVGAAVLSTATSWADRTQA